MLFRSQNNWLINYVISCRQVILGGGSEMFTPKERNDSHGTVGKRSDKLDLVQEWKNDKTLRNATNQFVYNRNQLLNVDINSTDYVLGNSMSKI